MTYNIAVAGKGGVGKTSLTGLLIDTLVKQKKDPILVVDADANCNLYEVLGSEEPETIGHIMRYECDQYYHIDRYTGSLR